MNLSKHLAAGLIGSVAAVSVAFTSTAAIAADFSGKRIEWIIPFKEGGGSDRWARFYAPLLAENLPGKPSIAVKNIPGGGSTKGSNQFAVRAKPNGLTILGTSGSTQFPYLLGDKRVRYEYKEWNIVLATSTGGVFYATPDLNVSSMKELATKKGVQLKYGSQGATSLDLIPLLALDMLDIPVKAVFGMKGRGAGRLAFQRGETNIDYQTSASYLKKVTPIVNEGKAIPLMSWGALDANGNVVRDPTFPDLPSFPEVYEQIHGKKPSGPAWDAWKSFFVAGFPAQKMIFLPKGTSQDIIDTWREAAQKTVSAPGFKEKSEKILGTYPQAVGTAAEGSLKAVLGLNADAKKWVQNWLTEKYNVRF
jgi:tripartite-type tricarboxylate transporter receptor subunit TctC